MRRLWFLGTLLFVTPGWPAVTNSLTVQETAGITTTNYPIQIGRPFAPGEIAQFPQAVIDGTPVVTQADVKQRWPEGSVKHAILSFLIPALTAHSTVTVTFRNKDTGNNIPLTPAEMLADDFNFDAVMELTNEMTQTVSARTMIQNGHFTYWTSGPIATTVILADHSATRTYDLGFKKRKFTALTTGITATDTRMNLFFGGDIGALSFPTTIRIENEDIRIASVPGNALTVAPNGRGFNRTTAASHSSGAVVESLSQATDFRSAPNDSYRSFRPIFIATFWPTIHKVRVRYIGEVANTMALEDQVYSLVLKLGWSNPQIVYSKSTFTHTAASRWTRVFWIHGDPTSVAINQNLSYLSSSAFLPNYDLTKVPAESAIAAAFDTWANAARDLYDAGNWTKAMGTTGGRPDIGPYPDWTVRWLYTGDRRMEEQAQGNADLAAAWPMHFREGDSHKFLDRAQTVPGIGRILSISDRKTISLVTGLEFAYTTESDKVIQVGPRSDGGWIPDLAHQPDPFSPQYLLTGDYWYLEEMYFWASWSAAFPNGAASAFFFGRGPTGAEGGLPYGTGTIQVRGQAWAFRNRVQAAFLAPDSHAEKEYFQILVADAVGIWEGMRNITGTTSEGNALWNWGKTTAAQGFGTLGTPPLHQWERGSGGFVQEPLDGSVVGEATAPWEQNFLLWSLGRAKELGYATEALVSWLGANLIGQITNPDYNPYLSANYRMPTVRRSDGKYFDTWAGLRSGFPSTFDPAANFTGQLPDAVHGYPFIALAAASMVTNEAGGPAAWDWIAQQALCAASLTNNPKWAILPRVISGNGVLPTVCSVATSGITSTTATITWTTDQSSDSQVEFGVTTRPDSSSFLDSRPTHFHRVTLTGLTPGIVYHFRVKSKDAFGNLAVSGEVTFQTFRAANRNLTCERK